MARMYLNVESPRRYFGDSSQINNWILNSGRTCYMTLEISDFLPISMVETDKYIEILDGLLVTAKQTGEF